MRASPLFMALLYFIMGFVFTYIAIQSVEETVWNFTTIILAVVATFDFAVAIRLIGVHMKIKDAKNKSKK
ncbi:lysylphosphatidylglycerol synthetase-like protein (DUF2156 family) [Salirhabdus euzebyi]|uniref:Lysylphosphatidylglycerol synthetase-like protein (DUF2156 family) n=1 Tax=Salirhabdus euzebyi TaxID=394506 RepID=A0A841Q918_9BACI|nr:YdiK family protein [Salirhabdus euzebyi]MBB6454865.1 lysylphosphatidylglycerol synthetase-like protein (DUF2156 family) [Salirhabdus euzebyi]